MSEGGPVRLLVGLASSVDAGSGARPVRGARVAEWEYGHQLAQFDAALADGTAARRGGVRPAPGWAPADRARRPAAVLDHLCSVGLPIGVAVFAPGAMQACAGRVHVTDRTVGGRVFAAVVISRTRTGAASG